VWEDDCIPRIRNGEHTSPHVVKQMWNSTLSKLSQHMDRWDIVLGATSRIFDKPVSDPVLSTKLSKMYRINKGFCTHWILYNASIYDRMIAWKSETAIQIDIYIYSIARVFVTLPFIAEQNPGYSFIENNNENYNTLFNNAERDLRIRGEKSIIDLLPKVSFKLPK